MIFFYVRHGDPIYNPDSLTPLGERQAEAVAKRLCMHGINKVYASTSNRAILTGKPTADIMGKEPILLDFCNEAKVAEDFMIGEWPHPDQAWAWDHKDTRKLLLDPEVVAMGHDWYKHPKLEEYTFEHGIQQMYEGVDKLFAELGYEHNRYTGTYTPVNDNDKRVALFAHQGCGMVFMSCLLDIPYPIYATRFDMCHSAFTAIDFHPDRYGQVVPRVMTLSNDSHLYREGLPLRYNHNDRCRF